MECPSPLYQSGFFYYNSPIMEPNYILLTPNIKIPKGNFAALYDLTGNAALYTSCLHAEMLSADEFEHCFAELRKTMELAAIDLEAAHRMEKAPSSKSYAETAAEVQRDTQDHKREPRITVKSLLYDAVNRRRLADLSSFEKIETSLKDRYLHFLSKQSDPLYKDHLCWYKEPGKDGHPRRFTVRSFVHDLYDILSSAGSHVANLSVEEKAAMAGEECQAILSFFYDLLRILYGLPGQYRSERCPIGEFMPIDKSRYSDLHLTWRRTSDIYVREQNGRVDYYLLKDISAAHDPRLRRELKALEHLWRDSYDSPNNILYMQGTIGHGRYARRIFAFPGRPFALDDDLIRRMDAAQKEELALGILKSVGSLHDMVPPLPHRGLSPSAFYICMVNGKPKPLLASFDTVKDLRADASFSVAVFLKDYSEDPRYRDFIAPDLLEEDPDLLGADIYSLGRLLSYIYTGRALSDGSGIQPERWTLISRMTDLDPDNRPDIHEVLDHFSAQHAAGPAFAVCSTSGRRSRNEDAFFCSGYDQFSGASILDGSTVRMPVILGVFDGLGGAEAGDEIAQLAARSVRRAGRNLLIQQYRDYAPPLTALAEKTDQAIREYKENNGLEDSGATMAVCLVAGNLLAAVNVGDSRIYRLRGDQLEQLSKDHCYAPIGGRKGSLYQVLGMPDDDYPLEPFVCQTDYTPGDMLILCTDGISDTLSDPEIMQILRAGQSLEEIVCSLTDAAEAAGASDNLTAVVFSEVLPYE